MGWGNGIERAAHDEVLSRNRAISLSNSILEYACIETRNRGANQYELAMALLSVAQNIAAAIAAQSKDAASKDKFINDVANQFRRGLERGSTQ